MSIITWILFICILFFRRTCSWLKVINDFVCRIWWGSSKTLPRVWRKPVRCDAGVQFPPQSTELHHFSSGIAHLFIAFFYTCRSTWRVCMWENDHSKLCVLIKSEKKIKSTLCFEWFHGLMYWQGSKCLWEFTSGLENIFDKYSGCHCVREFECGANEHLGLCFVNT